VPNRVLVIDDDIATGDGLAELLRRRGWEAAWVTCAVAAMKHWQLRPAGAVLLDWVLPTCPACPSTGHLLRWFLSREAPPRVVVLTGLPGELPGLPPGTPVLHKPADPEDIVRVLGEPPAAAATA
jgi:DNA-binding response OmpR family regulator